MEKPIANNSPQAENMYVAEWGNMRVHVMDSSGRFTQEFGRIRPSGLLIADKYVYVSDYIGQCDTSGQYVTSFGRRGLNEGVHSASRLVSMVSYMYVTISTTEF